MHQCTGFDLKYFALNQSPEIKEQQTSTAQPQAIVEIFPISAV